MEFFNFLNEYPKIGGAVIALASGAFTLIARNFVQFFLDKYNYDKELKTFLWKEKINAAKKASEYYFEYMNFLTLVIQQIENYEKGQIGDLKLNQNIDDDVQFYSNKLREFSHMEYHHINIFYDLSQKHTTEITKEMYDMFREIYELAPKEDDSLDEKERKNIEIRKRFAKLKNNFEAHLSIWETI